MFKKILSKLKFRYVILAMTFVALSVFGFNQLHNKAVADNCQGTVEVTPVFNAWPLSFNGATCTDLPLVDAKVISGGSGRDARYAANQAEHDAGINVKPGDQVRVAVYFHNGASPDDQTTATARNVRVGTDVELGSATTHTIMGGISADNARAVYSFDAGKGGNIALKSSVPTTLEYVPGTTQMCITDQAAAQRGINNPGSCGAGQTLVPLSDGIVNGVVSVGDIPACFEYSGVVIYTLRVAGETTPPPSGSPSLVVTKQVRNSASGSYGATASARQNDTVDYRVTVTNNGTASANNVILTDNPQAGINILLNTVSGGGNPVSGIALGNLAPNETKTITYSATITTANCTNLVNTASARADGNVTSNNASTTVNVTCNVNRGLSITKAFRDITQGNTGYVSNSNVLNGDTLEYRLIVSNTGDTTLNNVRITDSLPGGLNYVPGSFGISIPGNTSTFGNITVSSLAVGQSFTINYRVNVNLSNPNCGTLTNTATASADQTPNATASATANIVCNPTSGTISIVKQARNITQNTSFASSTSANPGDRVAYQIQVTATGGNASNVTVLESIPTYLNYVSGSARLNGNGFADAFVNSNTNIGNLNAGQTSTIYFEATIANNIPNCQQTVITNTANASADRMGTVSSSATVYVNNNNNCGGNTGFNQMQIRKEVSLANQNYFSKSVSANSGDRVTFRITLNNTGTNTLTNVWTTDLLPNGLSFVNGTVRLNNSNASDSLINNRLYVGNLSTGSQATITFDATVNSGSATTLTNVAQAAADNFGQIQDTASVTVGTVAGGNVNLAYSKRAFNETKNIDATSAPANREDFITYTLTVSNSGNTPATNFIISDDLAQVLNYASMVDLGGGTMTGNVISWPAVTVPAYGSVSKQFKVRVNYNLPQGSLQLVNTYGNTVVVQLVQPKVLGAVFVAPKTGASATAGIVFAALITLAYAIAQRKGWTKQLIAAVPKLRIE